MQSITLESLDKRSQNFRCACFGYFSGTPNGGDAPTCPVCQGGEYKYNTEGFEYDDYPDDHMINNNYCSKCNIMYGDWGCKHQENGCTDSIYNGHFINRWRYIPTNTVYQGMPRFDNPEHWFSELGNIEILEWVCTRTCDGGCAGAYYPSSKYPQYYHKCNLAMLPIVAV